MVEGLICRYKEVKDTRVVWIHVFGISVHVWSSEFFVEFSNYLGAFICMDEHTTSGDCFDVARIMIHVAIGFKVPDVIKVEVDGVLFSLVLREDNYNSPMAVLQVLSKLKTLAPSRQTRMIIYRIICR